MSSLYSYYLVSDKLLMRSMIENYLKYFNFELIVVKNA